MFRFFRSCIHKFTIMVALLRYRYGIKNMNDACIELHLFLDANPNLFSVLMADTLRNVMETIVHEGDNEALEERVKSLTELCRTPLNRKSTDSDLIDAIVTTLRLPLGGNRISASQVRALEQAILTPNEIGSLRESVGKKELYCGSCGKRLNDYELVTFEWGSTGCPVLHCYRCYHPQTVGCGSCEDSITIDRQFYVGKATTCPKHSGAYTATAIPAPTPTMSQRIRAAREQAQAATGVGRNRPPTHLNNPGLINARDDPRFSTNAPDPLGLRSTTNTEFREALGLDDEDGDDDIRT